MTTSRWKGWLRASSIVGLAMACDHKLVDIIVPEPEPPLPDAGSAGTGGSAGAAGSAGAPAPAPDGAALDIGCALDAGSVALAKYVLQFARTGGCLTTTAPIGAVAPFDVKVDECLGGADQLWELSVDGDSIRFFNVRLTAYLDVEMVLPDDATHVITFPYRDQQNQRFIVRRRSAAVFEIAPEYVSDKCLSHENGLVLIYPCDENNAEQNWRFRSVPCSEP